MPEILEKTRACVFSPTTITTARRIELFVIYSKQVNFLNVFKRKIVQGNAFYELYIKENEGSLGPEIRLFRKGRHSHPASSFYSPSCAFPLGFC